MPLNLLVTWMEFTSIGQVEVAPKSSSMHAVAPAAVMIAPMENYGKEKDDLVSDFKGDIGATGKRFSPDPGSIGPLRVAHLRKNVATVAWGREAATSDVWALTHATG
jgi:5,10-methylene-tetrahydrofolate dehydrogenase/methenyl tetrahydrofolate cyclohydrolase